MRAVAAALIGLAGAVVSVPAARAGDAAPLTVFAVSGDAVDAPLAGRSGDAARGRAIVLDRAGGNCLICHRVPVDSEPFQGELGPDLAGVGARLSVGQIRLRMIDQSLIHAQTLMPPYYRIDGLRRVAPRFAGQSVLSAQEIEDVVAWLADLK
ncbi:MAG: sulfur oxidation c-type cytochrome SoxX [Hyphomicrobiaceae bacterium]